MTCWFRWLCPDFHRMLGVVPGAALFEARTSEACCVSDASSNLRRSTKHAACMLRQRACEAKHAKREASMHRASERQAKDSASERRVRHGASELQ